ncbi:MAG: alanyl-tRNA editing protein [Oscillospiraceae bacterium]|nr:alanyl-tRNA editing protein [Oscillospiraceae bacterium]
METRKLYYEDCLLREFSAEVRSCEQREKGFEIILSATAFYPEGGGQACDLGVLGDARVLDVQERGEAVVHLCDRPLEIGAQITGVIDWQRRFDLMQQHTGEHMVSGVIHRRYGWHNVGFHMGSEVITIDFDGIVPAEDLPAIEAEVNAGIWADLPVRCWYPSAEELPTVGYRTKKQLPWPVRIVEIPGFDKCACCGVHTARTGQVGLVKLFTSIGCRGGSRLEMACGQRALEMLNQVFDQNRQVSQAFSAQITETGMAARRMNEALEQEKLRYGALQKKLFRFVADSYVNHGNVVHFEESLDSVQVRELADAIAENCGGFAAVFSGSEETGYGYAIVTRQGDLRPLGKAMNAALNGRGGGKPIFQQGRVLAPKNQIEDFFREYF